MSINIKVTPPDRLFNQLCTITLATYTKDNAGVPQSTTSATTASSFPCFLQNLSSTEVFQYGGDTNRVIYNLFCKTTAIDGTTTITSIRKDAMVTIDGVVYSVVGEGVDQTSAGAFLIATLKRET
jgi:hypothetical protein